MQYLFIFPEKGGQWGGNTPYYPPMTPGPAPGAGESPHGPPETRHKKQRKTEKNRGVLKFCTAIFKKSRFIPG